MTSRAVYVLVGLAACHGDAPSSRARVLDRIPANASSVFAASGKALSHPRFRPLVDALRPEVPAGYDCAVDAALAADQVALGVEPSGDVTIAIATRARVKCSVLSMVDDGLLVGTLGGGSPAAAGAGVPAAPEHARALPFLRDAPVALASRWRDRRVLATAQPDPLAAWVAFDAPDPAAAEQLAAELGAIIADATKTDAFAAVVKRITVERNGPQVTAKLGAGDGDLAVALRAAVERLQATAVPRAFPCPRPQTPVTACEETPCTTPLSCAVERDRLSVTALPDAFDAISGARWEPVIANGRVDGVRLRDDLEKFGLRNGDVLISIDGKRVTAVPQVGQFVVQARDGISLIVARGRRFGTIELARAR